MKSVSPTAFEIRGAVPSEAAALTELARRSKAYWGYSAKFMRSCEEELTYLPGQIDNGDVSFFVGEADGRVGGFYGIRQTSPLEYELEALFVEPRLIGQGLGRALVDHAKGTVRSMGGECLLIQGDPHAEGFYRAVGGERVGMRESTSIPRRYLPLFRILLTRGHRKTGRCSGRRQRGLVGDRTKHQPALRSGPAEPGRYAS
jgi:GNAT superfamily N-acetyltransferase